MSFKTLLLAAMSAAPAVATAGINLYWGQNGDTRLVDVCASDLVQFVTLTFVNESPEGAGTTGYPGTEYGAHCSGVTYTVNGQSSHLLSDCTAIKEDISRCQRLGTKVLLSIGGQFDPTTANYTVSTVEKGQEFGDFMWYAFGPYDPSWTGPRPFDVSDTRRSAIDGFDFDIEKQFDDQTPWIAMIERIREHADNAGKPVTITGAPECPLDDSWFKMKSIIVGAQFDILFIQFYNNDGCDAVTGVFNYDDWTTFLTGTKSAHAQLYIGLLGYPGSGYVEPQNLKALIDVYGTRANFGGISLWDEYFAVRTTDDVTGKSYLDTIKDALATVTPTTTYTSSIPTGTPICSNPYIVQEGEFCYSIADKWVISVSQILQQNPDLDVFCDVVPGQTICLPATATTTKAPAPTITPPPCAETYIVQNNDWCYKIADMFTISYEELRYLNPKLNDDCALRPGDVLCVKGVAASGSGASSQVVSTTVTTTTTTATSTATDVPTCTTQYTVQPSDYCYKIATAYGIDVPTLELWNPWLNEDCAIYPGQVLCVGVASTSSTMSSTTTTTFSGTGDFSSTITSNGTYSWPSTWSNSTKSHSKTRSSTFLTLTTTQGSSEPASPASSTSTPVETASA
ncbi:glycoside hydrolase [Thozetella sp. PMI_491]|nr:glycoside hydrolase [Thozetella sp. PMI_491]